MGDPWSKETNDKVIERLTISLRESNYELGHYKAEIERLRAALRRSCQCGEGMCAITGEQCSACAALEVRDGS